MAITVAVIILMLITAGCGRERQNVVPDAPGVSYSVCDTAADPLECHRELTRRLDSEKSLYQKFLLASDNAAFFEKEGMPLELGRNYDVIGNVMAQIGDTARARYYYGRADECFRQSGSGEDLYWNLIHRTNSMDHEESAATLRSLLRDTTVMRSPEMTAKCLQAIYLDTDSVHYLDSCLRVYERHPVMKNPDLAMALSLKAETLLGEGDTEGARKIIRRVREEERKERPITQRREYIHTIMAQTYYEAGVQDTCIQELLNVIWWTDSAYREANMPGIYARDTRRLIEMTERNARLEKREMALWWAVTVLGLLSAAIFIYYRAKRRQAASRQEIELLDSRLESVTHSHNAQSAVVEGSTRLIEELREAVGRHGKDGVDDGKLGMEVTRILNVYSGGEESRKGFLTVSREVNPRFSARLKADYPALSESQLRLAALIATGIDGQQLASILNISYKSLYTGRYRLRSQLGLTKNDSLEDFLRKYNS